MLSWGCMPEGHEPTELDRFRCYHEAGHAAVGYLSFGLRIMAVEVRHNECAGDVFWDDVEFNGMSPVRQCLVLLAGQAAHMRGCPAISDSNAAGDDIRRVVNRVSLTRRNRNDFDLSPEEHDARIEATLARLSVCARKCVSAEWRAVERLAAALMTEPYIPGPRAMSILGRSP